MKIKQSSNALRLLNKLLKVSLFFIVASSSAALYAKSDLEKIREVEYTLDYKPAKTVTIVNQTDQPLTVSVSAGANFNSYTIPVGSIYGNKSLIPGGITLTPKKKGDDYTIIAGDSKTFILHLVLGATLDSNYTAQIAPPLPVITLKRPPFEGYVKSCHITTSWHVVDAQGKVGDAMFPFGMDTVGDTDSDSYAYLTYHDPKALREDQTAYTISTATVRQSSPTIANEDVTLTVDHCDDEGRYQLNVANVSYSSSMNDLSTPYDAGVLNSLFINGLTFFNTDNHLAPLAQYTLFLKQNGTNDKFFPDGALKDQNFGFSFKDNSGKQHDIKLTFPNEDSKMLFVLKMPFHGYKFLIFYKDGYIRPFTDMSNPSPAIYHWSDAGIPNSYAPRTVGVTRIQSKTNDGNDLRFFLRDGSFFSYNPTTLKMDSKGLQATDNNSPLRATQSKMIAGATLGLQQDLNAPSILLKDGTLLLMNDDMSKIVGSQQLFNLHSFNAMWLNLVHVQSPEDLRTFTNLPATPEKGYYIFFEFANGYELAFNHDYCDPTKPFFGPSCTGNWVVNPVSLLVSRIGALKHKNLINCEDIDSDHPWFCNVQESTDTYGEKTITLQLAPNKQEYFKYLQAKRLHTVHLKTMM